MRADASRLIGSGHVMRCSAIAEELIARGQEVVFVGKISDLSWVEARVASLGFSQIYNNPKDFNSNHKNDILILDSYQIPVNDKFILLEKWLHIITIVDELTPDYSCTLRIHPGLNPNWKGQSNVPILSGPQYIPFRASISKYPSEIAVHSQKIKIVVVAGGSDPFNLVLAISNILTSFSDHFEAYLFSNKLNNFVSDSRFHLIEIGSSLDEVSRDANIVLTTSSTSSLEFIARGLCVGIACAVDNQKQIYDELGKLKAAAQIGFHTTASGWNLYTNTIHELITESTFREALINRSSGLIDFNGANRIVDAIISL